MRNDKARHAVVERLPTPVSRRQVLQAGLAGLGAWAGAAAATTTSGFPDRPVNLIVPFVPGGPVDITGRSLAEPLARELGQAIIVLNKGGAGGNIGAEEVARSAPDGYQVLLALDSMLTVNPHFYRDRAAVPKLQPIGLVGELSSVLVVNAKGPIRSVDDFLRQGRERGLTAGSGGNATAGHLYAEWLNRDFGVRLTHVPYKGLNPAAQDLLAGNIDTIVALIPGVLPHIQSGALRPLGLTSERPQPLLPEVPPLSAQGLTGFAGASWLALMAPAGLPAPIQRTWAEALQKALQDPATVQRLQRVGIDPFFVDASGVTARIQAETAQWQGLLQSLT